MPLTMRDHRIGPKSFQTKKVAQEHVRKILQKHEPGDQLAGDDFLIVSALLRQHPRAEQKIGCGIRAIRVSQNDAFKKTKCFEIVRADGTSTDFSYLTCFNGSSARADFSAACRSAVVADILKFKNDFFSSSTPKICAITCLPVTTRDCHVDHSPPNTFSWIVRLFIAKNEIDVESVGFLGHADNECRITFADEALSKSFRAFHNERATLRVTTPEANMRANR